jgi:major membrane immunogen (membrane-anchored lipoprotein)
MIRIIPVLFALFLAYTAAAQKPFTEGTIIYKVRLESPDHQVYQGSYTYTIKGNELKKELRLTNGFEDIILINGGSNTTYSLHTINGVKYAIQLSMEDITRRQQKYKGFYTVGEEAGNMVAGLKSYKTKVSYKDGSGGDLYYSKDWYATLPGTFERFPDAKFIPVSYSYADDKGITMSFDADVIEARPVESSLFRIPAGYKMISYKEYQQMSR